VTVLWSGGFYSAGVKALRSTPFAGEQECRASASPASVTTLWKKPPTPTHRDLGRSDAALQSPEFT